MKVAIDSYCYHRYFGEVYTNIEEDPQSRMSLSDFIERAVAHGVDGVSIESFMLRDDTPESLEDLRKRLDENRLARVWAWGHPRGLHSGTAPEELQNLCHHVDIAHTLGAQTMRICAGGRSTRTRPWDEHRRLLLPLLEKAANYAARRQIVLAIENHIDLLSDELEELVTTVDHPALGVCLDTANNLRMFEDPMDVVEKLAPYTRAVHLKDITAFRGSPRDFSFWPSVPLGRGLIDITRALKALRRSGYDGLLALEIDYLHPAFDGEENAIAESLTHLRHALAGMAEQSSALTDPPRREV